MVRPPCEPAMCLLVAIKILGCHCVRERHCLEEAQAKTLPGDGIYAARGVSGQRHISVADPFQFAHSRDRASFRAAEFRIQ